MYADQWQGAISSDAVNGHLHGGNFVATANEASNSSAFFQVRDSTHIDGLRFPGGDVVERYLEPTSQSWLQWFESDAPSVDMEGGRTFTTVQSFFDSAFKDDQAVDFVLPTQALLSVDGAGNRTVNLEMLSDVQDKVYGILTGRYGAVEIRQFEIGNEYYLDGRMSAADYGLVANEMIKVIDEAIKSAIASGSTLYGTELPSIIVQAGAPWQSGDNAAIIDQLDLDARAAVDGLAVHWYPRDLASVERLSGQFSVLEDWNSSQGFGNLDLHVTEWNVFNTDSGDRGFLQASTLIAAYDRLVIEDVSSADFWGVEFDSLKTRLGYSVQDNANGSESFRLSPSGEVIRLLYSSTEGQYSLNLDPTQIFSSDSGLGTAGQDYSVSSFGNAESAQVYFSWRSDSAVDLDIDLNGILDGAHYANVQVISAADDLTTRFDESDPLSPRTIPQITSRSLDVGALDSLQVELNPYSIVRLQLLYGDEGFFFEGQSGVPVLGLTYNDQVMGSRNNDTLIGNTGNDSLSGELGNDILFGGNAHDNMSGGHGNDAIFGGDGNDCLEGNEDADILSGEAGNDVIFGGDGGDILVSGGGDNYLDGGDGDDLLMSSGANDTLVGGSGGDTFFVSTHGNTIIADWSVESSDQVSFLGTYSDEGAVEARLSIVQQGEGLPSDLVITHDDGFETIVRGAGEFSDVFLASLFDQSDVGRFTLSQVELLSEMSDEQVSSFFGSLTSEEFDGYRFNVDPVLFARNLETSKLAAFFNGLDYEETRDFLGDISTDEKIEIFQEMGREEINGFLGALNADSLSGLMSELPPESLDWISGVLDVATLKHIDASFERHILGTEDEEDDDDLKALIEVLQNRVSRGGSGADEDEDIEEEPLPDQNDPILMAASCFVATVVYKDHCHPHVWLLRWYRDSVLRHWFLGRAFIKLYWHFGPKLAEAISRHSWAVALFRVLLGAIVQMISITTGRQPGRQLDHFDCGDSRLIRVWTNSSR